MSPLRLLALFATFTYATAAHAGDSSSDRLSALQKAALAARDQARVAAPAPREHKPAPAHDAHRAVKTDPREEQRQSSDQIWESLLEGNRRFVLGKPRPRELVKTRRRLMMGQSPRAIVLSCSDSRVGPELLFDQTLGDLFVVRTAGNVADPIALGSIEYAVAHLGVTLIVVLGHESCGAVKAAASDEEPESPNLRAIVKKIRPAIEDLDVCGSSAVAGRLKVQANIEHSAKSLLAESALLKERASKGELTIVRGIYLLATGEVIEI